LRLPTLSAHRPPEREARSDDFIVAGAIALKLICIPPVSILCLFRRRGAGDEVNLAPDT
jgi:hypothetical protein